MLTVDFICAWGNISIYIFKIWIRLYISVTSCCVMASQIITINSPTTRLFCFQKFVHDNPIQAAQVYVKQYTLIVCMRIPDNPIFGVVGLDQHGIYIDI